MISPDHPAAQRWIARIVWLLAAIGSRTGTFAQDPGDAVVEFSQKEKAILAEMSPLGPVPPDPTNAVADDPRAARLGQFVFFDPRFSANGRVSCATCHDPALSFTDGKVIGEGMSQGERHTPSLWNVAYNRWFFWDGRADTLWSQATKPFESPSEIGGSRLTMAHSVFRDADLRQAYETVFGALPELTLASRFPPEGRPVPDQPDDPQHRAWMSMRPDDQTAVTRVLVNVGKSIAAYQRRLVSRNSAFDRFVDAVGRNDAAGVEDYPLAAQRGLKLFIGEGKCRLCHSGPNLTDREFHDTRLRTPDGAPPRDQGRYAGADKLLHDPFNARGEFSDERTGAAAEKLEFLANGPQNWGLFKTPTLRNAALTAPYMHLGQLATLRDVMDHYSRLPGATDTHHPERILVRLNLTDSQIDDLVAFLESLTDASLDQSLFRKPPSP